MVSQRTLVFITFQPAVDSDISHRAFHDCDGTISTVPEGGQYLDEARFNFLAAAVLSSRPSFGCRLGVVLFTLQLRDAARHSFQPIACEDLVV